jgi:hypothetical protein
MNHLYAILGSFSLALSLFACSDSQRASTEVENELTVSSVQGIAASGYAMQQAAWELVAPSGARIAQGTTDSLGGFSALLDSTVAQEPRPWMVRVMSSTDTLAALLLSDTTKTISDTLFGMVNPITDFVARQLLGPAVGNPTGGYLAPIADSVTAMGERAVGAVFGKGLDYYQFSQDRNFRAALPGGFNDRIPTSSDMLLHSLHQQAENDSLDLKHLMDTLYQDKIGNPLLGKEPFRLILAANMAIFNLPPTEARPLLEEWEAAQGIVGDSATVHYYQTVWEFRDSASVGPSGTTNSFDPMGLSLEAASFGIQNAIRSYFDSNYSIALNNYSTGSKLIADQILPYAQQLSTGGQGGRPVPPEVGHEKIMQLGDQVGIVLACLRPEVWVSEPAATASLARKILEDHLRVVQPELPITPQAVAGWVDSTWESIPTVQFSADPRRQDGWPDPKQELPIPE